MLMRELLFRDVELVIEEVTPKEHSQYLSIQSCMITNTLGDQA